jgi:putative phosphonate metabolism protein
MNGFPRYAIYYAPVRGGALDRFGSELLGYDAWTGDDLPFPATLEDTVPDWRDITRDPRKYGFHATLKAPMALAEGRTELDLVSACGAFANRARDIPSITPVVNAISGFIAVVPAERSDGLERLAADCVGAFDDFRAPLTAEDRTRRNPEKLTPRQREYLDRWGYPYVMEEFRFHMTLTGRLDATRREPVLATLRQRFSNLGLTALAIDRIVLFRQDGAGARFRILGHWQLRATGRDG